MISPAKTCERSILTIGYEGLDIERFIRFLVAHRVEVLVDVREIPISRKRGFSKTRLSEALTDAGILYEHIKALGSPKSIRQRLKEDWNYEVFFAAYEQHLDTQDDALQILGSILHEHDRVCLMCFEKDHDVCHRRTVAARMAESFRGCVKIEPVNTFV